MIIQMKCDHHLGDNIINFIFFHQIKEYIEQNNIFIHYYCGSMYVSNISEFNCSKNVIINPDIIIGYPMYNMHQASGNIQKSCGEDTLCGMFNTFLNSYSIPIMVSTFEYIDSNILERFELLDNIYKNVDILVINSSPRSGQYHYNKPEWDTFITIISKKYKTAVSEKIQNNDNATLSLESMSVKNIAAIATRVKIIIAINTGPFIPLFNTHILDNVQQIYLFGGDSIKKTRKIAHVSRITDLSFLCR